MSNKYNSGVRLLKRPVTTTQAERDYAQRVFELAAELEKPRAFHSTEYDPIPYNGAWD
jgi:hypothetical protein